MTKTVIRSGGVGVAPDTAPGNYYVSAVDGGRVALLAGPFDNHADALAVVNDAKAIAQEVDPWAAFYAFGTVRMSETYTRPGKLNDLLRKGE